MKDTPNRVLGVCSIIGLSTLPGCSSSLVSSSQAATSTAVGAAAALNAGDLFDQYTILLGNFSALQKASLQTQLNATPLRNLTSELEANVTNAPFVIDGYTFSGALDDLKSEHASAEAQANRYVTLGRQWRALGISPMQMSRADFVGGVQSVYDFDHQAKSGLGLVGSAQTNRIIEGLKNFTLICTTITGTVTAMSQAAHSVQTVVTEARKAEVEIAAAVRQAEIDLKAYQAKAQACANARAAAGPVDDEIDMPEVD